MKVFAIIITLCLVIAKTQSKDPFVEIKRMRFPNGTLVSQEYRFYKVKSYIGLIAPKHIGGKTVTYKICYNKGNCTSGDTAFFGVNVKSGLPLNKENYKIQQVLISSNSRNIYDVVQWTNIHLGGVRSNIIDSITVIIEKKLHWS